MQHRLSQIQSQKLTLSPQIRQYLKLLQLPIQQLENTLEQEINENPALEEVPNAPEETANEDSGNNTTEQNQETETSELNFQEKLKKLDELDENFKESFNTDFSKNRSRDTQSEDEKYSYMQSLITRQESLADYLMFQLGMLSLSEAEKQIAPEIIGNVNEDGYVSASVEEIAVGLGRTPAEIEEVLGKLQTLDPPGVFARNLTECLLLQLKRNPRDTHLPQSIITDHLPLLEKRDYLKLSKKLKSSIDRIKNACQMITHLNPRPGRMFAIDETMTVIPDANVYCDEDTGELIVEMNDESLPQLRINSEFRRMLRDRALDPQAKEFVKNKVNTALWMIRALDQRKTTIKEITKRIVESQKGFFEHGFSSLKPLRLKDIAAMLNIHESTVSRAISGKYMRTPIGTIPYKSFFSTKMEGIEGPESQKSIMEKIRALSEKENPDKPLSDEKIVGLLRAEGIKIARRTAAKYRGLLRILPSYLRKHH